MLEMSITLGQIYIYSPGGNSPYQIDGPARWQRLSFSLQSVFVVVLFVIFFVVLFC